VTSGERKRKKEEFGSDLSSPLCRRWEKKKRLRREEAEEGGRSVGLVLTYSGSFFLIYTVINFKIHDLNPIIFWKMTFMEKKERLEMRDEKKTNGEGEGRKMEQEHKNIRIYLFHT
jgi:hypothetical protein